MTAEGLYIYCVAEGGQEESLDLSGIEGAPIWSLTHQGLLVIAQKCEPKPFFAEDQTVLADRLLIHQNIVDQAWERYDTIIPFCFDTLIVSTNGKSARQNLNEWLETESPDLRRKLGYLKNKAEFGVQVLWDPTAILPRIREQDAEMQHLEKKIRSSPAGVAYLLQRELEELIRQHLETAADNYFKTFYRRIRECVENVHVEKPRKEEPPKQMILNVSCLQNRGEMDALGTVLEEIGQISGFDVRFTGPWPPYSFVDV